MSKYLPRGLKLLDPRAMRQEDIVKIFKHISTRQISHGVRDAFRFKAVMTSRKGSNLDKTHYIDPLANPALLVMDPLDTEPNPASPSGPVPALPPVQRVFTSVFSIGDPSAIGGQSNPPEVMPNLTANTTRTARGRPEQHAFDNAGDDNQETTERRPRPRPRPTARGGKKVQGHASENAGHIRETPRPEHQALTFDPGHQWESNYDLDPSLDPGVELPSTSNTTELLTPWLTLTTDGSSVQTHSPTPAKSPRRKADMLAIGEAQSLIVKGKRRR